MLFDLILRCDNVQEYSFSLIFFFPIVLHILDMKLFRHIANESHVGFPSLLEAEVACR